MNRRTIPSALRRPHGRDRRPKRDRPCILVISGYVPNPITVRKADALHRTGCFDVHLAFWRSETSPNRYPFTTELPPAAIHAIDVATGETDSGNVVLRVVAGNLRLARFHLKLLRVIRRLRPDVIHASNSQMLICGWLACVGRPDRALVYDLLDTDDGMRSPAAVAFQRVMHRRIDRLTVPSPRFVTDFLAPLGLLPPETEPAIIANAPWRATFAGIQPCRGAPFVVGCIGSLRCQPAIEWLVASVRSIRSRGAQIEILFAGNGVSRPYVEQVAADHPFVTYCGPYDYATDIRGLYERVDAVYAVYEESWDKRTHLACRLSDAIAASRAIIVSTGTYMADLVALHGLGYAVNPSDDASLAAALEDAVRRRDRWRDPARIPPDLREAHTFETYVPQLTAIYAGAAERRRKAGA